MTRVAFLVALGLLACAEPADRPPHTARAGQSLVLEVPDQFELPEALRRASPGDVIRIRAGAFAAGLTIETPDLTIEGAGSEQTTLLGTINVKRDGFVLRDLAMRADDAVWGLHSNGHAVRAEGVHISGYHFGVGLFDAAAESRLDGLVVEGNQWGLYTREVRVRLTNSVLANNTKAGFFSRSNVRAQLHHNTVVGNGFGTPGETSGGIVHGPAGVEVVSNNIVVGNHQGMNCQGCSASWSANNVWGNVADFFGDARQRPGFISADPRFVNPAERDFRLRPDSPCIDAGADLEVPTDADGNARPAGGRPDLGAFEFQPPTAELVITEVMANPTRESTGEYVEVFNAGEAPVDLTEYFVTDGDARDEIEALDGDGRLAPGAYALILDRDFDGDHALAPGALRLTTDDRQIGNGLSVGDPVTLIAPDGNTVVSRYADPIDPGDGRSAERADLDGARFEPSPCGNSPGRACDAAPEPPADGPLLLITEVMANAAVESTGEYVEVMNLGQAPLDLAGYMFSDGDSTDALQAFAGTTLVPGGGGFALIVDPDYDGAYDLPADAVLLTTDDRSLGNGLANTDPITLRTPEGELVGSYGFPFDAGDGRSVELRSLEAGDAEGSWVPSPCGRSPARANCAWAEEEEPEPLPLLRITEVMANALDEDTGEFIELHNPGERAVDAAGLIIDDGDATDTLLGFAGGPTVIPAGAYAVILDPEYAGEYVIPAEAIRLRPDDTTIGSGLGTNDPIELRTADQAVIDRFDRPFNPGNGRSAERRSGAWVASECDGGASPGRAGCEVEAPAPRPRIIINEVMANPIDERGGEYVELLNLGGAPVDLADFVLDDGDARDRLQGWQGGPTLLPAGGYAVVLDRDYAENYPIAGGALRLTVGDRALGSGIGVRDPVRLFMPDGVTELSAFAPPFDPGNGRSAEREAPESDVFVAAPCDGPLQASPGGRNCAAAEGGDPSLCRGRDECPPDHQCIGIPRGVGEFGRCADIRQREGEWADCSAHEDCRDGLVCAGLIAFGEGFCAGDYHQGAFEAVEPQVIPDEGALDAELVVFGLGTAPLDILMDVRIDHPAPEQLQLELMGPSGDSGVVFDGARDDVAMLADTIEVRVIPSDGSANGLWVLRVIDRAAGGRGTLTGWGLEIISVWD